jgi:hypothetical protein
MMVTTTFDDVPMDAAGNPMLAAACEEDYMTYIDWLADYLYRPGAVPEDPLPEQRAGIELIGIEIEIMSAIWEGDDLYADYPPQDRLPANGAYHADILYRKAMSHVLSRVPDRASRIKLLHRFYDELNTDLRK